MWCVLAHVGDPHAFLAAAMRILRPGGVLFLRTPRHCSLDTMGETLARATAGRVSRLPDSRVTRGHLHLFSDRGMTELLNSLGFVDVDVVPVVHSGCTGEEILRRLGGPAALQRWSARMVDRLVASGTAPRNTMFVYARRPADSLQVPLN